jgi:gliding motility-associated-like protein
VSPTGFVNLLNQTFTLQPGGLTNATGIFSVTPFITTTYTIIGSGLNTQSIQATQTSTTNVTVNPQPIVSPTITQTSCTSTLNAFNLGLTFNPSNPAPTYTINWSPIPTGIVSPIQTSVNGTTAISPGLYVANITAAGGCVAVANININPQPAIPVFTLSPFGPSYTVTCANPTLTINASDITYNYQWNNNGAAQQSGAVAYFDGTTLGNWSVTASDPNSGCIKTYTFNVSQSVSLPTSTISPLLQFITCSLSAIQTVTATSNPTINVQHNFISPLGGTVSVNSPTAIFTPGPGTYTHVLVNLVNGCQVTKTFSITSPAEFPTFNVNSPSNFTLGCGTKSIITINIQGAVTNPVPGGAVSYTFLPPGSSTLFTTNSVPTITNVTVPGTWTIVVQDNSTNCRTKVPVSVVQNTFVPNVEAIVPNQTLTCASPTVKLEGASLTPNVSYNWSFPTAPGNLQGIPITIITTSNTTNTLVANYTLTVMDNNNTCKSSTIIPMYQNVFPPKVGISLSSTVIACNTASVVLTNTSSNQSPSNFPNTQIIQAYLWEGPPPQNPEQLISNYVAIIPGTYTLTAKNLNNGCLASGTTIIADNRIYPVVNNPSAPPPFILDCGEKTDTINAIYTNPTSDWKYQWFVTQGTATTGVLTNSTLIVNSPGIYRVFVTNNSNGCSSIGEVSIVNGVLTGLLDANYDSGFAPLNVTLYNNSKSVNSLSITSVWNFGNGTTNITNSSILSQSVTYNQPGTYTVSLFVSKGNCQDIAKKIIKVDIPSKLEVPNVFTPNGDGSNDIFFLSAANLTEITALIFDRWGNKVYELTSNTGNIAWDGKNQTGKDVAEGTYFYVITAKGKDDEAYSTKGNLSLYR